MPLYNSINLLCITPSGLGHSWKVLLTHLNSGNDCVMKTKESNWGLAEARLHVWLHFKDTDVVWQLNPTLLPPETRQENLLTGMGWRMRIHPGCATSESANHDQHQTIISTSSGGQAKVGQRAYNNDKCRPPVLCLAVCTSSWKQHRHQGCDDAPRSRVEAIHNIGFVRSIQ